jgi:hypothetical protein
MAKNRLQRARRSGKRRGRPRLNRPLVDLGTPELRAKRKAALGAQRPGWPAPDESAAENALGVLLWQGFLHAQYDQAKRMHDAGVAFCGWWVLVYPKTFTQGTLGRLQPGGSTDVDVDTAEAMLKAAGAMLGKERGVLDAVVNTCVYQRINIRQMEKLRAGLCRLVEWRRAERRKVVEEGRGGNGML